MSVVYSDCLEKTKIDLALVGIMVVMKKLLIFIVVFFSLILGGGTARADELLEIEKQLGDLRKAYELSVAATTPLESEVVALQNQIVSLERRIVQAERELKELEESIFAREVDMEYQRQLLAARVKSWYMRQQQLTEWEVFLGEKTSDHMRGLVYRQAAANQDKDVIVKTGATLQQLALDQKKLADDTARLAVVKKEVDAQKVFLAGEIEKAKNYQSQLTTQIAELSAKQQEILRARSGGFTVRGDSELADDYLASVKGFRESAPGGYFAVFSFGAYSHRNGMSQYGALGRAQSGQNAQQILAAYYPGTSIKTDYPVMGEITVTGHGSGSFEDWYLQRIYEVPSSWPKEVLKAQAIAARTYAVRRTNNGQSAICATEACQVFKNSPKGGAWAEAVNETRGQVLVDGSGEPVSTQFASTHGGWSKTSGWDTTDGGGGGNFMDKAYEKIGGSPWLYKAWWRAGYSSSGDTCGRSNPWLSPEEMADIVNAHVVLKHGNSSETGRISPVGGCHGGDGYSMSELRSVASRHPNGGMSSASSVSVSLGDGRTNSVSINGVSMSGDEFCKAFNLRAGGNLRIPQWSGSPCGNAFFNVERK